MQVQAVIITLYAPSAQTLKDKRQVTRSILDKVRHKFNVSIAEVDALELCQKIVLGIACVSNNYNHAKATIEEVVRFIENNADADLLEVESV